MCVPEACLCGRTWGRAVVPGSVRSYLKSLLRYDRVELRTTACGRDTTARFYIRPGEIAYDRAGPMAHDVEAVCAPRRCGLRRPAVHGPAARSGEHAVLGCAAAGSTGTDRRRAALAQTSAGPRWRRPAQGRVGAGRRRAASAQTSAGPRRHRPAPGSTGRRRDTYIHRMERRRDASALLGGTLASWKPIPSRPGSRPSSPHLARRRSWLIRSGFCVGSTPISTPPVRPRGKWRTRSAWPVASPPAR